MSDLDDTFARHNKSPAMMINVFVSGSPTTQMLIMYVCRHLHYLISFRKEKEVSGTQDIACFFMNLLPAHDSYKQGLFAS